MTVADRSSGAWPRRGGYKPASQRYRQLWDARLDELDKVVEELKRKSGSEPLTTRTFNGPARIVFGAWTRPELFNRWWAPKSMGMFLLSCEMDVRAGGKYRLEFESPAITFFGTYPEVTPTSFSSTWARARDGHEVVNLTNSSSTTGECCNAPIRLAPTP